MYFLDSNAIIDFLDGDKTIAQNIKEHYQKSEVHIPDIAYYEVLRGFLYKDPKNQLAKFETVAQNLGIEYIDLQTLRIAASNFANLKKNGVPINDDGDILIGALAIQHNAILVTGNTKHFERFDGIQLENWKIQ